MKALKLFCKEAGAPKSFIADTHPSQKSNEVRTLLKKLLQHFDSWRNQPSTLIELSCTLDE